MIKEAQLDAIAARAQKLEAELADTKQGARVAELSRAYAALQPSLEAIAQWRKLTREKQELEDMLAGTDAELRALAEDELPVVNARLAESEQSLRLALLPRDAADESNVILELRAGTGGQEAALFAGDLCNMYQRYAAHKAWKAEIMSASHGEVGGFKEVVMELRGEQVFAQMKYESGVHRVQRVPVTESGGRIHTSAATVAVLPEPRSVDIVIHEKDLRIDVFRASGPGGQSVNTTDSAVRITHLPSNIVVSQQDEKSQHKNRAKAMQILRARLFEAERNKLDHARAAERKAQIGSGDRSQRVRTYNFPQARVTDHRIGLTLHKLHEILNGEALDELILALRNEDQARALAAMDAT